MSLFSRKLSRILAQARYFHKSYQRSYAALGELKTRCTMIPGDGVGPELMYAVQEIFKTAGVPVEFETYIVSEINPAQSDNIDDVIASVQKNRICLQGVVADIDFSPTGELKTINMKLRTRLDLYANVVHVMSIEGIKTRHKNIDVAIIREQTEGEYSALEHETVPGLVECLKIVTRKKSMRIAKFAFDYATKHDRKKITCVHKANIMKLGDGLFLKCCEEMSKLYPLIEFENMIVDNTAMQMISNPHQFDILVTPNLYGSIIDNLASGLVGGAGVVPGASYSSDYAIFQPGARHPFSVAVGKNIANPTAMILCATKMLKHIDLSQYCDQLVNALFKVIKDGKVLTKDMGGQSTTTQFTSAVIQNLK